MTDINHRRFLANSATVVAAGAVGTSRMLGAGGNRAAVRALAERWLRAARGEIREPVREPDPRDR